VETEPAEVFSRLCRFLRVDDAVRPENLGSRENETRRIRFPRLFNAILRTRLDRALPEPARERLSLVLSGPGYPALDPALRGALDSVFEADQAVLERFPGAAP
jgi:hypothetical protein